MAKTPTTNIVRKTGAKAKSSKTTALTAASDFSPTINLAVGLDENLIRERAYGIWIEEGRPHGRDLAHWRRAHHELQRKVL